MHVHHLILVNAKDWKDAIILAEEFLRPFGESNVWDWYSIGGRWNWKNDGTKEDNVLCVGKDKQKAEKLIRDMLKNQQDLINEYNKDLVDEMKNKGIVCLKDVPRATNMVGYYLKCLGKLISGYYCFDSYFYDVEYGSAYIDEARIQEILKDGNNFYIVNFDLHN